MKTQKKKSEKVRDAKKVKITFRTNERVARFLLLGVNNIEELNKLVSEKVERLVRLGMKIEDETKLCEVCSKEEAKFQCKFCGKWLCPKCLGTFIEIRKCCGKEDEITMKARTNKLGLRQIE